MADSATGPLAGGIAVGLALPQLGPHATPEAIHGFAVHAEEIGFHSLWVQERLLYPLQSTSAYGGVSGDRPPDRYRQVLSPTELMTAAAAWTSRIRIGASVLVAGYHRPVELAKRLATIDVLSHGRLDVGVGVGWSDDEHLVSQVDPRTRGARCDDFIDALLACWSADPVVHDGPFFTIPPSEIGPKPVQRPRPRLLFGMFSDHGYRRTVRYADGWAPSGMSVRRARMTAEELNSRRVDGQLPLTVHHRVYLRSPVPEVPELGSVEEVVAEVVACRDAGFDEVIIELNFWEEIDSPASWIDAPARLAPALDAARRGAPALLNRPTLTANAAGAER